MHENADEVTRPYVDIKSLAAEDSDLDEMDEADDVELDEDESDPDKTVELDLAGKKKPAARKPRASRKKKEPEVVEEEITAVLEPKIEAAPKKTEKKPEPKAEKKAEAPKVEITVTEPVTVVAPKPIIPPHPTHSEDHLREDVSIAAASLHKTMDSMVRQWSSVKEISGSICTELERVNTMLKVPAPQADPVDIKAYLKEAAPRITLANKIALGVSAAAVVFSIISLSLASSTRHTLMDRIPMPRVARAEAPVAKAAEPVAVKVTPPAPVKPVVAETKPEAPVAPVKSAPSAEIAKAAAPPKKDPYLYPPKLTKKSFAAKESKTRLRYRRTH